MTSAMLLPSNAGISRSLPMNRGNRRPSHGKHGAEPGRALHNALICLRSFGQRVGLDYRFDFSLGYVIQGFVEIFGAILLAADDLDALEEQLDQRERKRFRIGAHNDEPAVRAQTLNAVHHGFGRVGGTEDDVGAARCGKALSVADNFIRAQVANHLVFIGGVRNRDGLEARGLRVLHRQVPKPADSKYGHALVRLRIGPAEPAINGIPGAKDRCGLLVGNLVGNQVGSVGVHRHVLGVTALRIAARALQIGAEHPAAALAPFAPSAGGLNPCRADAVADLASGHIRTHGNDLAHRLVAKDSRKLSGKVSKRLVHIGVADAACMHLHLHLTRTGLRLRNIFDLPGTAGGGYDCGFHTLPPRAIRCECLCFRCMILHARIAILNQEIMVCWRMVGKPSLVRYQDWEGFELNLRRFYGSSSSPARRSPTNKTCWFNDLLIRTARSKRKLFTQKSRKLFRKIGKVSKFDRSSWTIV